MRDAGFEYVAVEAGFEDLENRGVLGDLFSSRLLSTVYLSLDSRKGRGGSRGEGARVDARPA